MLSDMEACHVVRWMDDVLERGTGYGYRRLPRIGIDWLEPVPFPFGPF